MGKDFPPAKGMSECMNPVGQLSGYFSGYWGQQVNGPGNFLHIKKIGKNPIVLADIELNVSFSSLITFEPQPTLTLSGKGAEGQVYTIMIYIEEALFRAQQEIAFHGFSTVGMLFEEGSAGPELKNYISIGKLSLLQAGMLADAPVLGMFQATLL